ncbi:MAG: hypothetical protein B7Y46_12450 [Acidovorax sp. 28-64-14]|nr:MAG: hypothetical protein B7Y46_12450 [Acidovorax sp. 28-64-14]
MTTRIDTRFAQLKKEGRAAFVTFVMCGDPDSSWAASNSSSAETSTLQTCGSRRSNLYSPCGVHTQ